MKKQVNNNFNLKTIIYYRYIIALLTVLIIGAISYIGFNSLFNKNYGSMTGQGWGWNLDAKPFPPLIRINEYQTEEEQKLEYDSNSTPAFITKLDEMPELESYFRQYVIDNSCQVSEGRLKITVLAVSNNKTQALFSRACGSGGYTRNFLIKDNGTWNQPVRISTYQSIYNPEFSPLLDLPNCELVNKYSIQKSIAPVCFNREDGKSDLFAGDTRNYSYTIR